MPLWRGQGTRQSALYAEEASIFFLPKKEMQKKHPCAERAFDIGDLCLVNYSVQEITDMLILFSLAIPTGRPKLNTILVVGFN